MPSLNVVTIMGNLTRDPELRYLPSGTGVCEYTLALNSQYTKDGQKIERVEFIDVVAYGRLAEVSAEYLKKGRATAVVGHLTQDRWEDSETGRKRSKIRITADEVRFVGSGSKDDAFRDEVPFESSKEPRNAGRSIRKSTGPNDA